MRPGHGGARIVLGVSLLAVTLTVRGLGAQSVTAGLSPDSISGVAGQLHTVALQVGMPTTTDSLGSYSVTITWDSTIARVDSVRAGAFGTPTVNYVSGGEVRFTAVNTDGMTGVFSLALLHFRIVNDTIGRRTLITLSFTDLVATDFTDLRAGAQIVHGVVRVLAPPVIVHFTPDSTYERVGHKPVIDLTADLSAANGVALGSYTASFTWDPAVMVFDSIRAGDYVMPQWNQSAPGELRLSAADPQGRGGTAFSLARLHFSFVNATFPTVTAMSVTVSEMSAALSFANLLPGVVTRTGKAVIGGVLRGDTDVSGALAALDAQLILQGAVGLTLPAGVTGVPHGDADCGGTLQARDAQIVLNAIVGNPVSQFCVARIQ
jgi:hypothetical protein